MRTRARDPLDHVDMFLNVRVDALRAHVHAVAAASGTRGDELYSMRFSWFDCETQAHEQLRYKTLNPAF
jgi:hypothetical protein